ncbi:MAG: flagellar hook assembly protein FlgD [Deltaproteobacteria bacterium]|nr:flagellar hook assembly protein FlgD [Deltaproteobacteria bacterium]
MPTPILDLTSPKDATPPSTDTRQGSNKLGKDEFLKLLVAQLANQDPTKPQDSSAFVAQLAQFSSLEQQQNTVSRLDTLLMGQATANQTQAASFIGKNVAYRGNSIHMDGLSGATASASLTTAAENVSVMVIGPSGENIRTIKMGAHKEGDVPIEWDGRNEKGVLMPAGDYTLQAVAFDADGKAVPIKLTNSGNVTGVAFEDGVPVLRVGGSLVKMSDVTSINERNTP